MLTAIRLDQVLSTLLLTPLRFLLLSLAASGSDQGTTLLETFGCGCT